MFEGEGFKQSSLASIKFAVELNPRIEMVSGNKIDQYHIRNINNGTETLTVFLDSNCPLLRYAT